ncbi:hypothetical protein OQ279_14955 [Salinimicrobium sp. MT39]|uniref:Fibronectin type-III domain-containing protein n=1 Tax=Salinimicrobium profundisediminis TaxID=2994553 RepID=A0A9X3CZG5_9FLAO|nr:hypothetical protein [Salinimicrobium profundisediminis]MCX2839448.1 hypothetical protein [Salinimicrobium profundisediminis]
MKKNKVILALFLPLMFFSCEEILLEEDLSGSKVELLAPVEGTTVATSMVAFNWTAVEGATAYQFQIAAPNFDAPQQLVVDEIIEENFTSEELQEGSYEWRVRALNSGFTTTYASAEFTVKATEDFSEQQVKLFSPSNNFLSGSGDIVLNWGEVEEATVYRVQILQNEEVVVEKTTSETHLSMDFVEGQSTWRVRAENDSRNTLYFERTVFVDTKAPESPTLLRPADKANFSLPTVTFEWDRNSVEGSEEIDSLFVFKDLELADLVVKERVTTSYATTLDREETYYWFMKSYDSAGNVGERSEVFSFTIEKEL